MKNKLMYILTGGGGSKLSRATSISPRVTIEQRRYARVERATGKTALLTASASVGVLREAQYPRCAFTMAEILLSLTIIGVVAAITLPSLTGNINERTWNTQRKALYARISQAVSLMPSLNGYGTLDATTDNAAETFVTDGLSKVLKINNICDSEHLTDCGVPDKITTFKGNTISSFPKTMDDFNPNFNHVSYTGTDSAGNSFVISYGKANTKAAAFETANGESIVVYYNPSCAYENIAYSQYSIQHTMCANFVYDLNGSKGPNTVGKDIGVLTVLNASDSRVVSPYLHSYFTRNFKQLPLYSPDGGETASKFCTGLDSNYRLVNKDELVSIYTNKSLFEVAETNSNIFTSSDLLVNDTSKNWRLSFNIARMQYFDKTALDYVLCVMRN